ncbi:hypothetical protein VTN00DRAFT_5893 [Thermoascus crustaceus]|uniref:uncharacterized protein n=1 Tax=Thermoascus crustaceus TaxID=5088 RepID=UPI00374416E8
MFLMKCKTKQTTPYVIFTINTPLPSPLMCLYFPFFSFLRLLPNFETRMAVVYIFFSFLFLLSTYVLVSVSTISVCLCDV